MDCIGERDFEIIRKGMWGGEIAEFDNYNCQLQLQR